MLCKDDRNIVKFLSIKLMAINDNFGQKYRKIILNNLVVDQLIWIENW